MPISNEWPARIHFAANDDRGNFTGRAQSIQIELPGGDEVELALEVPVACFGKAGNETVRIGGRQGIRIRFTAWRSWVGNMAWEAASITVEDAKAVIRWLLQQKACVESYTCGGDIEKLIEEAKASNVTVVPQ